jgi:hypothetical protein
MISLLRWSGLSMHVCPGAKCSFSIRHPLTGVELPIDAGHLDGREVLDAPELQAGFASSTSENGHDPEDTGACSACTTQSHEETQGVRHMEAQEPWRWVAHTRAAEPWFGIRPAPAHAHRNASPWCFPYQKSLLSSGKVQRIFNRSRDPGREMARPTVTSDTKAVSE